MKLTKEQMQYIDAYLERSGVKFWDVRMELLDYFATGIEQKMTNEALGLEEALGAMTIAFGNITKKRYVLNEDNTQWIPAGTFSTGEGFKKLEREKQKQIGKKHAKAYWKQVKALFFSRSFYAEFILMILIVFTASKYSEKWALGVGFLYLFFPFLVIGYNYLKGEIPKKSLHMHMSMLGLVLWLQMFSLVPNGYKMIYDEKLDFQIYAWMLILIFPFIKASFVRFNKISKELKKHHDLIA
jgi:hypothetical protein